MKFSPAEEQVLIKVLHEIHFQAIIGGGEWNLTDNEEYMLWEIIKNNPSPKTGE